jgi:hypothetical protein
MRNTITNISNANVNRFAGRNGALVSATSQLYWHFQTSFGLASCGRSVGVIPMHSMSHPVTEMERSNKRPQKLQRDQFNDRATNLQTISLSPLTTPILNLSAIFEVR